MTAGVEIFLTFIDLGIFATTNYRFIRTAFCCMHFANDLEIGHKEKELPRQLLYSLIVIPSRIVSHAE